LKEAFELSEGSMQGCLAEFLSGLFPLLLGKMPLKGDRLFKMKWTKSKNVDR
jgi:hypothetical protein